MDDETIRKINDLAKSVLKVSRNTLIINLRFMDTAISRLTWTPYPGTISVDGTHIFYNPLFLLPKYGESKEFGPRAYLHLVMHCVFRHFVVPPTFDRAKWNLACNIAVENVINELRLPALFVPQELARRTRIMELERKIGLMTAERIYAFLQGNSLSEREVEKLEALFDVDDHTVWYMPSKITVEAEIGNGDGDGGNGDDGEGDGSSGARSALIADWKDIGERMQLDLETFSKQRGDHAGSLMQNLKEVNREKYDYTAFLKKFAVTGEAMKINDDEFDYIFYTYGLNLYPEKRMPLIEPLEYKDVKRIREFVIAIDTSGSVSGELAQAFIQKTYNILKSTESFVSKINLHIIQCDADIQEHVKITSQEEFDEYLKNMTIKGFGGTDFRPVFETVDKLIAAHEFSNLKGLIYFTDGFGVFPARMPAYRSAFVFVDDE